MAHIGNPRRRIYAPPETIPVPQRERTPVEDVPAPGTVQPKEPVPA